MVIILEDADGKICHDEFEKWRSLQPSGRILACKSKTSGILHGSKCEHFGTDYYHPDPRSGRNSLTRRRKVLDESGTNIALWAKVNGVSIKLCKDCERAGDVALSDLEIPTQPVSSTRLKQTSLPVVGALGRRRTV